jgi:hypothetical protein
MGLLTFGLKLNVAAKKQIVRAMQCMAGDPNGSRCQCRART